MKVKMLLLCFLSFLVVSYSKPATNYDVKNGLNDTTEYSGKSIVGRTKMDPSRDSENIIHDLSNQFHSIVRKAHEAAKAVFHYTEDKLKGKKAEKEPKPKFKRSVIIDDPNLAPGINSQSKFPMVPLELNPEGAQVLGASLETDLTPPVVIPLQARQLSNKLPVSTDLNLNNTNLSAERVSQGQGQVLEVPLSQSQPISPPQEPKDEKQNILVRSAAVRGGSSQDSMIATKSGVDEITPEKVDEMIDLMNSLNQKFAQMIAYWDNWASDHQEGKSNNHENENEGSLEDNVEDHGGYSPSVEDSKKESSMMKARMRNGDDSEQEISKESESSEENASSDERDSDNDKKKDEQNHEKSHSKIGGHHHHKSKQ